MIKIFELLKLFLNISRINVLYMFHIDGLKITNILMV